MTDVEPAAVAAAADDLYAVPPERFTARRAELVAQLRSAGEPDAARAVGALRKPTVAAALVNALYLDDPQRRADLEALGAELRAAQDALDGGTLRELTLRRRALVAEFAALAFSLAGRRDPPAALRDDVTSTLDAAVADPDVAAQLGRLTAAQHFSGFGVTSTAPELTLVRGGRSGRSTGRRGTAKRAGRAEGAGTPSRGAADTPAHDDGPARTKAGRQKETQNKEPPKKGPTRRALRALESAEQAFEDADASLVSLQDRERDCQRHAEELGERLALVQRELTETRAELQRLHGAVREARGQRRSARSALDRAERAAGR